MFSITLYTKSEICFRNLLKLWKNGCSHQKYSKEKSDRATCYYSTCLWIETVKLWVLHAYAVLYAMQLSALWKLHINSVPLFNWLKCFSALTVVFFYKLHHLKTNEMSLFRIHGSGKRTAQQRRFNWIGFMLHVLPDVFMLEGLWVSFMVDDQIWVYFPAISHCYV